MSDSITPSVSVIVPVYKAEAYLHRCVDSLLAQTFKDFEIILVDDGSPDHSGEICDVYAKKDLRVRAFHKENGGVTSARLYGINKCNQGKYIFFVDSDDEVPKYALQELFDAASEQYDIVVGRMDNGKYEKEELSVEEFRSYTIEGKCFPCGPCGRLIKLTLFDAETLNIPRAIVKGEDMLMNIRLAFANTKKVRLVSSNIYHYCSNIDSCIHTFQNSLEYEILFDKYRELSIPSKERKSYQRECIVSKLRGLSWVATQTKCNTWKNTSYFKSLMNDVKNSHIKIPFFIRLKLFTTSKFFMRILIMGESLYLKIRNNIYER